MCSSFDKFNKTINDLNNQIDLLLKDDIDTDIIDHLTKHLILLMAGYVEKNVKNIVEDCLKEKKIPKEFKNFILESLPDSQNLNPDKLKKFLNKFDSNWEQQITQDQSSALGSIIRARNEIAHCKDIDVSKENYLKHFDQVKKMLDKVKQELFDKI
ncbi:HEPN domain-containing protein [Campylobacter concisus]|uniref:HEPN domain-containing protein n=1 Tax=Campylobacter concisus TaxID=199 RepID=UPI000D30D108|nr:HEPN domain-containing protein [Campylobacter concisus]